MTGIWAELIDPLDRKQYAMDDLRARRCRIDVCCFYVTSGVGGPAPSAKIIGSLAAFNVHVSWDVYIASAEEYTLFEN